MLTLSTTQQAAVDAKYKKVTWLFKVTDSNGANHYWATKKYSGSSAINWASGVDFSPYNHWTAEEYTPHAFKIVDFRGIQLQRNKNEIGIVAPNDLTFSVVNSGNTYKASDFDDGKVLLTLVINDVPIRRWRFHIRQVEPKYQKLSFVCEDFLQEYLKGYYPNTRLVRDIFASSDVDNNDGVCVPIPFGTAYVPVRSVFVNEAILKSSTVVEAVASSNGSRCKFRITENGAERFDEFEWGRYVTVSGFTNTANNGTFLVLFKTDSELELSETSGLVGENAGNTITLTQGVRYYVLGDPDYTYDIDEVRSPRSWGRRSVWTDVSALVQWGTGTSWVSTVQWRTFYTFLQYTKTDDESVDWRVFLAIIADADNNGIVDSPGVWRQGDSFLDMPTKFSRSDTSALTNPSDVIKEVLRGFGAYETSPSAFADAKATFASWGLLWNGALWYKEQRPKLLSRLLAMCNSNLIVDEQIELKPNSRLSQKTITASEIIKENEVGEGTFSYNDLRRQFIDNCGYVAWQESGEAQDKFVKTLVPATGSTKTQISREIVEMSWVQDSQDVQALATLYYQRKLMKAASVGCVTKSTCLALNPGDVVTIDGANYGGGEVDDETGATWGPTVHGLSFANGQAFMEVSGVDLSLYAGGSDTPYELIIHDSSGYEAHGWIGSADAYVDLLWASGTSWQSNVTWSDPDETLGSELIVNGTMEADANWGDNNSPTTNERSAVQHVGSAYSRKFTVDEAGDGIRSDAFPVTAGKLYKLVFWVYPDDSTSVMWGLWLGDGSGWQGFETVSGLTQDAWNQVTLYFTAEATGTGAYVAFSSGLLTSGSWYIDDVSFKEVTHIGADGVHIMSKEDGTTQSWAEIDSGFNYNDTAYTFEVTQRYPVVIDSMMINKDLSIQLACSRYSCALDDFTDLTPSAITVIDDDTSSQWSPVIAGPLTDENMAIDTFKTWDQPYLIVGPTAGAGQYTSIQAALNALKDSNHSGIYIKSGTYNLDQIVYVPNKALKIIGESQNGVIINNNPGSAILYFASLTQTVSLSNLTLRSRDGSAFSNLIEIATAPSSSTVDTAGLNINEISFDLSTSGTNGIYLNPWYGNINISKCRFSNGSYGINSQGGVNAIISECIFNEINTSCVYLSDASWFTVIGNSGQNLKNNFCYLIGAVDLKDSQIMNNKMGYASSPTACTAIYIDNCSNVVISKNIIEITHNVASLLTTGIRIYASRSIVAQNVIQIGIASDLLTRGIISSGGGDSIVSSNYIYLNNTNATTFHYGIFINTSSRNVISGNNVDLVNNNANDIGIKLDSLSLNNQGGDNLTYNCGTGIDDDGTGNTVTGKDV